MIVAAAGLGAGTTGVLTAIARHRLDGAWLAPTMTNAILACDRRGDFDTSSLRWVIGGGFVLMAAFFFGALSVFDREIDRWAIPSTRFEPQPMPSYEKILRPAFERMQPLPATVDAMRPRVNGPMPERFDTVVSWSAYTTHRDPVLQLFAGYDVPNAKDPEEAIWADATIDPRDGTEHFRGQRDLAAIREHAVRDDRPHRLPLCERVNPFSTTPFTLAKRCASGLSCAP